MLLLEGVLVVEEDVAIQILEASGLAETQELVVNKKPSSMASSLSTSLMMSLILSLTKSCTKVSVPRGTPSPTYPSEEKVLS